MNSVRESIIKAVNLCIAVVCVMTISLRYVEGQERAFPNLDYHAIVERGPRPRSEVQAFVKDVSSLDARFEVTVNQGRLLTLHKDLVAPGQTSPLIAVGDPTVFDFQIIDTRHLRITGKRIGVTDLSIVLADGEDYNIEVTVVIDLTLLEARLRMAFPDAELRLVQHREHIIVDGQARDTRQVAQILEVIQTFLDSAQTARAVSGTIDLQSQQNAGTGQVDPRGTGSQGAATGENGQEIPQAQLVDESDRPDVSGTFIPSSIINLIRVPGPQQVMLKVQVAELNRTALRRIGTSLAYSDSVTAIGSTIGPALPGGAQGGGGGGGGAVMTNSILGLLNPLTGTPSTLFGVFDGGRTTTLIDILRTNQVLTILAEPTLVALHGQEASFRSGGRFPVPIIQPGGGQSVVTIEYREFGVSVDFVPFILDEETIRLAVAPEVSSIDFSTGVVINGTAVPGEITRNAQTTVEMRQGQTLAIAGILQVDLNSNASRVPGLGDLPVLGTFFRNTSNQRLEKELVVLVTPHLVESMDPHEVPPIPGSSFIEPNDKELYFEGRLEGRGFEHYRSTESWDDPIGITRIRRVEQTGRATLR